MEKYFCPTCGKEATGYRFCTCCGTPVQPPNGGTWNNADPPPNSAAWNNTYSPPNPRGKAGAANRSIIKYFSTIVVISILIVVAVLAVTIGREQMIISDVKEITFEAFTTQTIGYITSLTLSNPEWSVQKKSTDYYWVTVSGYYPDLSIYIDATFDVYYYGDNVSASISHAYVDGEYFDDEMSLLLVMGILCGAA